MPADPRPPEMYPPLGDKLPEWAKTCCVCGEPVTGGRYICERCGYSVARTRQDETAETDEPPPWIGELEDGDA